MNNRIVTSLEDLQRLYLAGDLNKSEFIARACQFHQLLWTYLPHLRNGQVKEITLSPDGIQFLIGEECTRLWAPSNEARVAPLESINFGSYEPEESNVMNILASGAKHILDVGANIGYHAIRLAIREPNSFVHAFEPLPATFQYLHRNVALNNLSDRVFVYSHALSNANGSFDFYTAPENGVNASLKNVANRLDAKRIVGLALKLDEWTTNHSVIPEYIKIDVEGAELLVLEGAKTTLANHKPRIFAELLRKWSAPFGYHPNDVLSLMSSLGYGCWGVNQSNLRFITNIDENTVETNYAFLHFNQHADIISSLGLSHGFT